MIKLTEILQDILAEKKLCKKTGFRAWYLTTDPLKAPLNNQLKLF